MIAKNKSLYYFPLRSGQNSWDYSIYSILCSFFFFPVSFDTFSCQHFSSGCWKLLTIRISTIALCLCLSYPALVHVCSHTLAQFSQWSCAKITPLCWTKQHIGLQAAKSLGIIHPKYCSQERRDPARGFCVKIVKKVSGTKKKIFIHLFWFGMKRLLKNESLGFEFASFLKQYEIFVICCLLRFYRSWTQNNKRCIFTTLSHNWNRFSSHDFSP